MPRGVYDEIAKLAIQIVTEDELRAAGKPSPLLKHFLAAKVAADDRLCVTLAYLFWEPADAPEHKVFAVHRNEAEELATALVDDHIRLKPLSYRDLWLHWDHQPVLTKHVAALRARYGVRLA